MTIDLRREVERALDRNGLVEAGWTTEAIEEAMAGDYATSRFSKLEAAVVMPFIEAIARERDALREALEEIVCWKAEAEHTFPDWKTCAEALAEMAENALAGFPALTPPEARQALNTGDQS